MDGLSVLYSLADAGPLYKFGNAHGWLASSSKTAASEYHLSGRLYAAKSGWLLLSVPNALVRGVFDALTAAGAELPLAGKMNVPNVDKELLNAHISVMTADEVSSIGANKINERGHAFQYSLGPVKELTPHNIDGISKVWAIQVSSPQLSALRKSYGLSPLPNGDHPFHITVAVRRRNVLRDNDVSKFDAATGRGELKAAADDKTTYECGCAGRCMCPDTCVCKKSGSCGHSKAAEAQPRVRVVLPYKGQYLLETLNNPKWPQNLGKRRFIGGGVESGETPAQAAARELFEELGVKVKPTAFSPLGTDPDKPHEHYLQLAKHKLKPGDFNATVGSDPVITLAQGLPAGDDYIGPDIKKLLAPVLKKAADRLYGGEADNMPDSQFPPKALAEGKRHEHEHTTNDQIAGEIAKDHLQEDPAYYKKVRKIEGAEKAAMSAIVQKLREAKEHSDNKRYQQKNQILKMLMEKAPEEWVVDDPKPYHVGVTHVPTKFRLHADPRIIPPVVPVSKAAGTNPYFAQLFNTTARPAMQSGKSIWQNMMAHLRGAKERGDRQLWMQENSRGLLAELNPAYKQQLQAQITSKNYPRPDFLTRLIQQHGDGALNAIS